MDMRYDELAKEFLRTPVDVFGVYRTQLGQGTHAGHKYHRTSKCALVLALEGRATFRFDGTAVELAPGKALLGGVNRSLELEVHTASFEYFLVHYLPEPFEPKLPLRMTAIHALRADIDPPLLHTLERLLPLGSEPDSLALLEKRTLFYRLLHQVLLAERRRQNPESSAVMEQTMRYIREHYMEPITLQSLADRCGMKAKYFSHLFRKFTGISPIHYLIRYRMNRAFELLMTTRFTVSEVARSVGYADPYYFSRLFKKHQGMTPNDAKAGDRRGNNPS